MELLKVSEMPGDIDGLESGEIFQDIVKLIEKEFDQIKKRNPTCKRWVQYCKIIFLMIDFVFAEKSGDWELHLKPSERMLPFFHVTGHFHYAQSVQIYHDDMKKLFDVMDKE